MVEVAGLGLFLYRPVAWCFIKRMKYLSILMVGVALLVGGFAKKEIAESKQAKEEAQNKAPIREVSRDELEYRAKIWYLKGETEPFTGTSIHYRKDGSKWKETPYVDGKEHGMEIEYREDGSKWKETPYVDDQKHGTAISYYEDGSKLSETPYVDGERHGSEVWYKKDGSKLLESVYKNGKIISRKDF